MSGSAVKREIPLAAGTDTTSSSAPNSSSPNFELEPGRLHGKLKLAWKKHLPLGEPASWRGRDGAADLEAVSL